MSAVPSSIALLEIVQASMKQTLTLLPVLLLSFSAQFHAAEPLRAAETGPEGHELLRDPAFQKGLTQENVADADTVLLLHLNEVQGAANAGAAAAAGQPNFQVPFSIELIGDPHGERGVKLKSVNPGPSGYSARQEGILRRGEPGPPPIWRLMQAYSKQSIAAVEPVTLAAGQKRWTNAYKEFTLGNGTPDADFILAVNSIEEYGNQYRSANAPWPHLLLEQDICAPGGHLSEAGPSLADCQAMTLRVSVQLRYASNLHERDRGYSEGKHAAQFQLYFTLQNLNRQSPGYGEEYVWFGVPFYDDRYPVISPSYMMRRDRQGR